MTKEDLLEIEYLKKLSVEEIQKIMKTLKENCDNAVKKYDELSAFYRDLQKRYENKIKKVDYTLLYKKAILVFGAVNQQVVALEELSELQKEITKLMRGQGGYMNLAEEIADVEIVIEQLKILYGVKHNVDQYKAFKNQRLLELINEKSKE